MSTDIRIILCFFFISLLHYPNGKKGREENGNWVKHKNAQKKVWSFAFVLIKREIEFASIDSSPGLHEFLMSFED